MIQKPYFTIIYNTYCICATIFIWDFNEMMRLQFNLPEFRVPKRNTKINVLTIQLIIRAGYERRHESTENDQNKIIVSFKTLLHFRLGALTALRHVHRPLWTRDKQHWMLCLDASVKGEYNFPRDNGEAKLVMWLLKWGIIFHLFNSKILIFREKWNIIFTCMVLDSCHLTVL